MILSILALSGRRFARLRRARRGVWCVTHRLPKASAAGASDGGGTREVYI